MFPYPPDIESRQLTFLARVANYESQIEFHEDELLQTIARSLVPMEELEERANAENYEDDGAGYHSQFILELMRWFKRDFFSWCDHPKCTACGGDTHSSGSAAPTTEEREGGDAHRVELHLCAVCNTITRFPRYNNPGKLLETRSGRCGEWANAFYLFLRALGYDARFIVDWTDHVWTEVGIGDRWMHADPCEVALDTPLMYEVGWNKKLSYVLAFSVCETVDVSWRYSIDHGKLRRRRIECRESALLRYQNEVSNRKRLRRPLAGNDKSQWERRRIHEVVEFLVPRTQVSAEEVQGRSSGGIGWRLQRGEVGGSVVDTQPRHVFVVQQNQTSLHLRYNCALDYYVVNNGTQIRGWRTLVYEHENISRKEELDWKNAYLARTEGTPPTVSGKLTYLFEIDSQSRELDRVTLHAVGAVYGTGRLSAYVETDKETFDISEHLCLHKEGRKPVPLPDLSNLRIRRLKLAFTLDRGSGDVSWQHAQLFRCPLSHTDVFELDFEIFLKPIPL